MNAKTKMITVELSRADLEQYVDLLADRILCDSKGSLDGSPAEVARWWRKERKAFIADGMKWPKGIRWSTTVLKDVLGIHDHQAALIERLCPLLEAAT